MNHDLLNEMAGSCILSREENNRLAIEAKNGNKDAVRELFSHNYKLISSLSSRHQSSAYSEEDLFQDGTVGMLNALADYDEGKASFTTYAFSWIREMRAKRMQNGTAFHYSSSFYNKIRRLERLEMATGKTKFTNEELNMVRLFQADVNKIRKYRRSVCSSIEDFNGKARMRPACRKSVR